MASVSTVDRYSRSRCARCCARIVEPPERRPQRQVQHDEQRQTRRSPREGSPGTSAAPGRTTRTRPQSSSPTARESVRARRRSASGAHRDRWRRQSVRSSIRKYTPVSASSGRISWPAGACDMRQRQRRTPASQEEHVAARPHAERGCRRVEGHACAIVAAAPRGDERPERNRERRRRRPEQQRRRDEERVGDRDAGDTDPIFIENEPVRHRQRGEQAATRTAAGSI